MALTCMNGCLKGLSLPSELSAVILLLILKVGKNFLNSVKQLSFKQQVEHNITTYFMTSVFNDPAISIIAIPERWN